jgi:hypothetical protein
MTHERILMNRRGARWLALALVLASPGCEIVVNPDPTLVPGFGGVDASPGIAVGAGDAEVFDSSATNPDASDARASDALTTESGIVRDATDDARGE